MSSCQYRRGACILATRHGSHMLQGEGGPQGGDNLQPACNSHTHNHPTICYLQHASLELMLFVCSRTCKIHTYVCMGCICFLTHAK